jgi:hypothetical protein
MVFKKTKKVNMKKIAITVSCVFLLSAAVLAQIVTPAPSPGASFMQKFGFAEIKVEYSRPGVKGRKIFGGVLPYGQLWRTGANEPTRFTTSDSITVAGVGLAKGTYIILTIPSADSWDIIFNKNPLVSYTNYKPEDNVVNIKVKPEKTVQFTEFFTIDANNLTMNSCDLELIWENTLIKIPITNDVDSKVMTQIKQKLEGVSAGEYNAMARYYYDTQKDNAGALDFVDKGIAKGGETYGNTWLKSLILARSGDKKGAIIQAKKSIELAQKANNQDYVRMNEKSIAEWSK